MSTAIAVITALGVVVAIVANLTNLAKERLARGLALARPQGAPVIDALFVEGTAAYLAQVGEEEAAYLLLAAAHEWRQRLGVAIAPVVLDDRRRLDKRLAGRLSSRTRAVLEERAGRLGSADLLALTAKHLA